MRYSYFVSSHIYFTDTTPTYMDGVVTLPFKILTHADYMILRDEVVRNIESELKLKGQDVTGLRIHMIAMNFIGESS